MHEYKGYKWNTQKELAKQLGKANSSISAWKYKHPDKNIYDYIDAVLDAKKYGGVYKDLQWESYTDLEKKLGKCRGYIHTWLNKNEGKILLKTLLQEKRRLNLSIACMITN